MILSLKEVSQKLDYLFSLGYENERFECKAVNNNFPIHDVGKYFSALSNEANLKNQECGRLILGVKDKTFEIVGTDFRQIGNVLNDLKSSIAQKTGGLSFIEIYEIKKNSKRVVVMQIPPAIHGSPTKCDGIPYGRNGEHLGSLDDFEIETIKNQRKGIDRSGQILHNATIDDLDPQAIKKARQEFIKRHQSQSSEIEHWSDSEFLNKAKITIHGKLTNAAMILLGKETSSHLLSPHVAQVTWILKDESNNEISHEHIFIPLIFAAEKVFGKLIRNLKYRYLQKGTLFPIETSMYDEWAIRELFHNCLVHQDYDANARITIVEFPDKLIFSNQGVPFDVEKILTSDIPPNYYKNNFLKDVMYKLSMIDTLGSGIRKVYNVQRARFFPMPEYEFDTNTIKVTLMGKILDEKYAEVLAQNESLSLHDIILLDKVQKNKKLDNNGYLYLKRQKLIEGTKKNYYISLGLAQQTNRVKEYVEAKSVELAYQERMICEFVGKHKTPIKKSIILDFMKEKLESNFSDEKKYNRITNILMKLKKQGKITSIGKGIRSLRSII